jgi:NAD(P)-dependent dehydrogenase (short-subunit alcohol dehydrogenase family)
MRLANKIGIVTAAASGMGRAGALRFAREGAAVGVADIDAAGVNAVVQEITAAGGRALALVGDLRTDDFARDIVRQTARAMVGSILSGTMWGIPARRRSRGSTWPISSWRSTSTCAPSW